MVPAASKLVVYFKVQNVFLAFQKFSEARVGWRNASEQDLCDARAPPSEASVPCDVASVPIFTLSCRNAEEIEL